MRPLLYGLLWLGVVDVAGAADPLPDPLTLDAAIAVAEQSHPAVMVQQARVMRARAQAEEAQARSGVNALIDVSPLLTRFATDPTGDLVNDSRAQFAMTKQLTDFGRSRALVDAAQARVQQQDWLLADARSQHKLVVMSRFLEVILADLKFHADDEEMTRLFTQYDRARERSELGMTPPVELLQRETAYRTALVARSRSEADQYAARVRLALSLNRPDQVPENLTRPTFAYLDTPVPDYNTTVETIVAGNAQLAALREEVKAAERTIAAENALRRPVLTAGIEATTWEQKIGSREDARIGLRLRIPLYQGGIDSAVLNRAVADHTEKQAELTRGELTLRRTVMNLIQELTMLKTARQTAKARLQYRELAADEARAQYELEIQTTLGESLARLTEAEYLSAKADFDAAVTWESLKALAGGKLPETKTDTAQ